MIINPYRFGVGGPELWTPLNMTAVPQIYIHCQDSVVTDVSGFASEISNLGAMGSNGNFSQASGASRPAILSSELNGNRVLSFDGIDDNLNNANASAKAIFTNVAAAWAFVVYKKRTSDGSPTTRYMIFTPRNDTAERFSVLVGGGSAGRNNKPQMMARRLDANSVAELLSPNVVQGSYVLSLSSINYSTRAGILRENGAQVASNATLTASAGNTSNTTSTSSLSIGAYFTGTVAADIDIATVVMGNTQPTLDEFERLEGWAAHEWGLASNLPVDHPYKTDPPTV